MLGAPPATPAFGNHQSLPALGQVTKQAPGFLVINKGARRYRDNEITGIFARHVIGTAARAALGGVAIFVAKSRKGIQGLQNLKDNAPSAPAISSVWAASRYILLAVEMHRSIPAVSSLNPDFCSIDKHKNLKNFQPPAFREIRNRRAVSKSE
jgi:hypothetical protein